MSICSLFSIDIFNSELSVTKLDLSGHERLLFDSSLQKMFFLVTLQSGNTDVTGKKAEGNEKGFIWYPYHDDDKI